MARSILASTLVFILTFSSVFGQSNAERLREIATHADKFYITHSYYSDLGDGKEVKETKDYFFAISHALQKVYLFRYSMDQMGYTKDANGDYKFVRTVTSPYFAYVDVLKLDATQLQLMDSFLGKTHETYGALEDVTFAKYIQHCAVEDRQKAAEDLVYLAEAALKKGEGQRALEIIFRSRSLNPEALESMALLVDIYAALGRFSDAASMSSLLVKKSAVPAYLEKQVAMHYFAGDYANAIKHAETALTTITDLPAKARVLYFKGLATYLQGDKKGGMDALEQAYKADPTSVNVRMYYGLVLSEFDRLDEAKKIYEGLVAEYPNNANILYSAAEVFYKIEPTQGCRYFSQAMRTGQAPTDTQKQLFSEHCQGGGK